jgi:hypothetical protein
MEQSERIDELAAALVQAKLKFGKIKKSQTGRIEGTNAKGSAYSYEYKYADLAHTLEAVESHLLEAGVVVQQDCVPAAQQGFFVVVTQLTHTSGQWQRFNSPPMPYKDDPKRTGASQSYGRRYGVAAALSLATEDDTDAAGQWDDHRPARHPLSRPQADRSSTAAPTNGRGDPGSYVFPIGKDKGYKGKPICEVPEGYLRHFVMGESFDKEDIKEATQAFLDTLAPKERVEFLTFAVEHTGGDKPKFEVALEHERDTYFGKVRRGWYDAAYEKLILGRLSEEQIKLVEADWATQQGVAPDAPDNLEDVTFTSGEESGL